MPDELTPPDTDQGDVSNTVEPVEQMPAAPVEPAAPQMPPPPVAPVAAEPPSRATLPPEQTTPEPPADNFTERLERLGGEPAPVITPEEFARLQNAGQVHIDAMGRVRTARRASQADAGVTLRKRRAWY